MISNFDLAFERACDVFGDREKATEWMDKQSNTLGTTPRAKCKTDVKAVLNHLKSIEFFHGQD